MIVLTGGLGLLGILLFAFAADPYPADTNPAEPIAVGVFFLFLALMAGGVGVYELARSRQAYESTPHPRRVRNERLVNQVTILILWVIFVSVVAIGIVRSR